MQIRGRYGCNWTPSPVPEGQKRAALRILSDMDRELTPAPSDWIAARIVTLLAHFWMPDMPENLHQAISRDWISVLGGYPRQAIDRACLDYLRDDTSKRPTPGKIRKLCEERVGEKMRDRDRLRECLECKALPRERGRMMTAGEAIPKFAALRDSLEGNTPP